MVVDSLVLVQRREYIAVFHLALSLAGAWSCLERTILKNFLVYFLILLSLLMRMINDPLLCTLKIVNKCRRKKQLSMPFVPFFHAFYSMHIFLTAGQTHEKMHAGKVVKVKIRE